MQDQENMNEVRSQQQAEGPVKPSVPKGRKYVWIAVVAVAVVLLGLAGIFYQQLQEERLEKEKLQQLAELDKKEMENEYAQFALQYDELKKSIKDDSLMERLSVEQARNQELLDELKKVKATDAAEIIRLKKELVC